jgi:hypothetical protein
MAVFGADDPSALRLFFRSLLPNFNPAEPQPEGAVGGEGQDGIDLRSVPIILLRLCNPFPMIFCKKVSIIVVFNPVAWHLTPSTQIRIISIYFDSTNLF